VSIVVGSLAGGMGFEEVQREYDQTNEDIRAALKFAGELLDQEQQSLGISILWTSVTALHGFTGESLC